MTVRDYSAGSEGATSRHIYRTPSGMYYDDRTGKRLSKRRGEAAHRAAERANARFRDETGKFETRLFEAKYDASYLGSRRAAVYGSDIAGPQAHIPLAYNPNRSARLSDKQARRWLDAQEPSFRHYNVSVGESVSGMDEE